MDRTHSCAVPLSILQQACKSKATINKDTASTLFSWIKDIIANTSIGDVSKAYIKQINRLPNDRSIKLNHLLHSNYRNKSMQDIYNTLNASTYTYTSHGRNALYLYIPAKYSNRSYVKPEIEHSREELMYNYIYNPTMIDRNALNTIYEVTFDGIIEPMLLVTTIDILSIINDDITIDKIMDLSKQDLKSIMGEIEYYKNILKQLNPHVTILNLIKMEYYNKVNNCILTDNNIVIIKTRHLEGFGITDPRYKNTPTSQFIYMSKVYIPKLKMKIDSSGIYKVNRIPSLSAISKQQNRKIKQQERREKEMEISRKIQALANTINSRLLAATGHIILSTPSFQPSHNNLIKWIKHIDKFHKGKKYKWLDYLVSEEWQDRLYKASQKDKDAMVRAHQKLVSSYKDAKKIQPMFNSRSKVSEQVIELLIEIGDTLWKK
jgi:hypothetical protein